MLQFEWDDEKNRRNIAKHGISFHMAAKVFLDEQRIEIFDEKHSAEEDRYRVIGRMGEKITILTVIYKNRGENIRLISARKATKWEEAQYYDRH